MALCDSTTTTCDGFTFESDGTVYIAEPGWFWANLGVSFAYYVVMQGLLGSTLGKLMVGLRVVRPDGSIANVGWAALRWLFFFVDGPLTFFICGLVTFLVSKGHRRVGDMIASTYVVSAAQVGHPVVLPAPAALSNVAVAVAAPNATPVTRLPAASNRFTASVVVLSPTPEPP